jgi:hypothetical protein
LPAGGGQVEDASELALAADVLLGSALIGSGLIAIYIFVARDAGVFGFYFVPIALATPVAAAALVARVVLLVAGRRSPVRSGWLVLAGVACVAVALAAYERGPAADVRRRDREEHRFIAAADRTARACAAEGAAQWPSEDDPAPSANGLRTSEARHRPQLTIAVEDCVRARSTTWVVNCFDARCYAHYQHEQRSGPRVVRIELAGYMDEALAARGAGPYVRNPGPDDVAPKRPWVYQSDF